MKIHNDQLDVKIAKVLRLGVLFAGALILVGWLSHVSTVNFVGRTDGPFERFRVYENHPLAAFLETLVLEGNWGELISYLGLAVLIALPALRVFLTFLSFLRHRDFVLAILAAVVFVSLMISFSLGLSA